MSLTITQSAPSPDYSSHEDVDWTVRHCTDCGDICLTAGPDQGRCDTCEAAHRDELATAKRLLTEHRAAVVAYACRVAPIVLRHGGVELLQTRSGGMNDPREILCDECGEVAVTYTGNVDSLDRQRKHGECGCYGVIDVDQDDEGHVRARFVRQEF